MWQAVYKQVESRENSSYPVVLGYSISRLTCAKADSSITIQRLRLQIDDL